MVVAVIDSGVNYNLPEFDGKMWDGRNCVTWDGNPLGNCQHGYNFVNNTPDGMQTPNVLHGTQVASLIAAKSNNEEGMVSIAPDVEIMSINVAGSGGISSMNIVQGILFAKENGADIINLSIGSKDIMNLDDLTIFDKLTYSSIKSFSGLVVNSAGNEGANIDNNSSVVFPAVFSRTFMVNNIRYDALPNLVVVGSHHQDESFSSFSNYGINTVDIIAPGGNIIVTGRGIDDSQNTDLDGTEYDMISGTFFSSPIVAGALAFAKSAYPDRSWNDIRAVLMDSIEPSDIFLGYSKKSGRLHLANAMNRLESEYVSQISLSGSIIPSITEWTKNDVRLLLVTNKKIHTPNGWEKISDNSFSKIISENTQISVDILSEDNTETVTLEYLVQNIDKNSPQVQIVKPENNTLINDSYVDVAFTGSDDMNGVSRFECRYYEFDWQTCQSPYRVHLDHRHATVSIRAIDGVENISTNTSIVLQVPNITSIHSGVLQYITGAISQTDPDNWKKNVELTLFTSHPIRTPNGWTKKDDSNRLFSQQIHQNGHIVVILSDDSGRQGIAEYDITNIDSVSPILKIISSNNGNNISKKNVEIVFESIDQHSGIDYVACQINSGSIIDNCQSPLGVNLHDGQNSIRITAFDKAGNSSIEHYIIQYQSASSGGSSGSFISLIQDNNIVFSSAPKNTSAEKELDNRIKEMKDISIQGDDYIEKHDMKISFIHLLEQAEQDLKNAGKNFSAFRDLIRGDSQKYTNLAAIDIRLFIYEKYIFSSSVFSQEERLKYIQEYIQYLNLRNNLLKQYQKLY